MFLKIVKYFFINISFISLYGCVSIEKSTFVSIIHSILIILNTIKIGCPSNYPASKCLPQPCLNIKCKNYPKASCV